MQWLQKFMRGRYGMDQLGVGLIALYFIIMVIGNGTRFVPVQYLAFVPAFFCFWRMLSRNIVARQKENMLFLRYWRPVQAKLIVFFGKCRIKADQLRDKEHKYFSCKTCGATLRVPRGKGNLQVTCPKCHTVTKTRS